MTEWAKFVSGVMFLDFFGPRSAVPFFAPVRRQRGAGRALLYRCRAHQTRETRLT